MPSLDDLEAGGPPSEFEADGQSGPIGVPADFTAPITDPFGMVAGTQAPRYFSGHQRTEATSLLLEERADLQLRLMDLGLLKSVRQLGVWDDPSASAFKQVLGWANANGWDWKTALDDMASSAATFDEDAILPGEGRAPLTTRVSNPEDLREAFRQVAIQKMGGTQDLEPVIERMVAAYQAGEQGGRQQAYDAAETGGTITEQPSVATFADRELKKADPVRYDARRLVDAADMLFQDFAGGGVNV